VDVLGFFFLDFFLGLGLASELEASGLDVSELSSDSCREIESSWTTSGSSVGCDASASDAASSELSIEICGDDLDLFFLDFFLGFGLVSGSKISDLVISEVSIDVWRESGSLGSNSTAISGSSTDVC